jgi:hypothetical protein
MVGRIAKGSHPKQEGRAPAGFLKGWAAFSTGFAGEGVWIVISIFSRISEIYSQEEPWLWRR